MQAEVGARLAAPWRCAGFISIIEIIICIMFYNFTTNTRRREGRRGAEGAALDLSSPRGGMPCACMPARAHLTRSGLMKAAGEEVESEDFKRERPPPSRPAHACVSAVHARACGCRCRCRRGRRAWRGSHPTPPLPPERPALPTPGEGSARTGGRDSEGSARRPIRWRGTAR
jgi:hypothetical protein